MGDRVIITSAGTHADGRAGLPSQPQQQTTVFQLSSLTSPLRLYSSGGQRIPLLNLGMWKGAQQDEGRRKRAAIDW